MYIDNGFQPPEVLPLQNGVDGASMVRSIVNSWGKGHPLVGWCNIVAAIQDMFAMAVVMSNVLLLEAMPKKVRCQNSWLKSSVLEETYLPKDPEKKHTKTEHVISVRAIAQKAHEHAAMHGVTNGRLKLQLFGHEEPGLIKHWAANPPAASYLQTKATFLVGHNFRSRIQHEFWSNDSDLSRRSPHLGWRNIMIWPDEFTPFFSFAWGFFRCHFGSTGCGRC